MDNIYYMKKALSLARESFDSGEVPVGCVIANARGEIVGQGRNRREELKSALSHAELHAIDEACRAQGDWRLERCTLYVTLEPCPMCAGAIINARIPVLVFGAREENFGSCGSVLDLFSERYGHHPKVYSRVLEDECAQLMREFFRQRRERI